MKSLCINKTPLEQMLVGMTYVFHHHYLVVDVAVVRDPEGNEVSYGFHLHRCQRYMPERMETM